jgi:hypothetical protein
LVGKDAGTAVKIRASVGGVYFVVGFATHYVNTNGPLSATEILADDTPGRSPLFCGKDLGQRGVGYTRISSRD